MPDRRTTKQRLMAGVGDGLSRASTTLLNAHLRKERGHDPRGPSSPGQSTLAIRVGGDDDILSPMDVTEPNAASELATGDPDAFEMQALADQAAGLGLVDESEVEAQGIADILQQIQDEMSGRSAGFASRPRRRGIYG